MIFKITKIPRSPKNIQRPRFIKTIKDLSGLTKIPNSSKLIQEFEDFIKIPPCCCPFWSKPIDETNCFLPIQPSIFNWLAPTISQICQQMSFKILRLVKRMFSKHVPMFWYFLKVVFTLLGHFKNIEISKICLNYVPIYSRIHRIRSDIRNNNLLYQIHQKWQNTFKKRRYIR